MQRPTPAAVSASGVRRVCVRRAIEAAASLRTPVVYARCARERPVDWDTAGRRYQRDGPNETGESACLRVSIDARIVAAKPATPTPATMSSQKWLPVDMTANHTH